MQRNFDEATGQAPKRLEQYLARADLETVIHGPPFTNLSGSHGLFQESLDSILDG